MAYYMGIDIGTSSVKTLIMDEEGNVVSIAQRGYDIEKKKADYAEQDMKLLWKAAAETIREASAQSPGHGRLVRGIGYSGQMHGLVMVDKNGELLQNAIIWADQRTEKEIEQIYSIVPREEYEQSVLNSVSTGFLISSLMWIKEHEPRIYERIGKVMLPKDYIRYRMCGEYGTDMSDASGTGIFRTEIRDWAWELIDQLGIERSFFVPCRESWEIAGNVSAECELQTGLKRGISIVYGGGDCMMQALGNGMLAPDTLSANIGTASQLACSIERPLYDLEFRTNTFCHVREDRWVLAGANLSGGIALKWLMSQILGMKSFDEMMVLASEAPPGSEGLLFLPYLSGERTPYNDPQAKGIYFGLTLKHTRTALVRSTMEGIVFALKNSMEIFKELGIDCSRVAASGGGARGKLFRTIQADVLGKAVYTNLVEEQACMGAAITAAVGTKEYDSYEEACERIVRFSPEVTEPNSANQCIYKEQYEKYKELYPRNRGLF